MASLPPLPLGGQWVCIKKGSTAISEQCTFYDSHGNVISGTKDSGCFGWGTLQTITKITYDSVNYVCNLPQEGRGETDTANVPVVYLKDLAIESLVGKIYLGDILISDPTA